jgi:hypothetical protein
MNVEAATDAAHMLPATTLLAATLVPATLDIREMDTHAMVHNYVYWYIAKQAYICMCRY